MGKALYEASAAARGVYEEASDTLGFDLAALSFRGPEEELVRTKNTQPAILAHSAAMLAELRTRGFTFTAAAGHSLGEYSAYLAAGSLTLSDALRLVRRRGELMYEAGLARPGAMGAILGLKEDVVAGLCAETPGVVGPANLNSPGQIVISGEPVAVRAALEAASVAGAKRVVPLKVSGAFHSPLMEPAADGLAEALAGVEIRPATFPVVANAMADVVVDPEAIRKSLVRQLLSPVLWEASMQRLLREPGGPFLEVGPGKVLRGLLRSIDRSATCSVAGTPEDLLKLFPEEAGKEVGP